MRTKCLASILAISGLTTISVSAADPFNFVVNGSFEDPQLVGTDLAVGCKTFLSGAFLNGSSGWVVSQNSIDIVHDSGTWHWAAQDGHQSVDLNGSPGVGAIKQTMNLPAGEYELSFWYAGNFLANDHQDKAFSFTLDGYSGGGTGSLGSGTPDHPTWTEFRQRYTITGGAVSLEFKSLHTANAYNGPVIDSVSLVAVPEPYHYGLAAITGLFGLVFVDRARQRKLSS